MSASSPIEAVHAQLVLCKRFGQSPAYPAPDSKCGVSSAVGSGNMPLSGLRHPEGDGTNGWYLWVGETLSDAPDFFQPLHYEHLSDLVPSALPYLALPPGWRFLIAEGYEDVWFDETLLTPAD
jgi:hypothetical protein